MCAVCLATKVRRHVFYSILNDSTPGDVHKTEKLILTNPLVFDSAYCLCVWYPF